MDQDLNIQLLQIAGDLLSRRGGVFNDQRLAKDQEVLSFFFQLRLLDFFRHDKVGERNSETASLAYMALHWDTAPV